MDTNCHLVGFYLIKWKIFQVKCWKAAGSKFILHSNQDIPQGVGRKIA